VNEYEITKTISSLIPGCVVPPIALLDINHNDEIMKLLITEWSKASEQFCHQFIEGSVDPRIAPKIAETLAVLNTIRDFDPNFNVTSKSSVLDLFSNTYIPRAQAASTTDNPKNRTEVYCSSLGEDVVMRIVNANIEDYKSRRDCLNHADAHGKSSDKMCTSCVLFYIPLTHLCSHHICSHLMLISYAQSLTP